MAPIRTLLVDDGVEFLEAVSRFLASDPEIEVIGQAVSAADALEKVEDHHPDLVLMDIALPDMNGLEVSRRLKSKADGPRVIVLTLYDNREYRRAAQKVHVDGYVTKPELGSQLLPLIHSIFKLPAERPTQPTRAKS